MEFLKPAEKFLHILHFQRHRWLCLEIPQRDYYIGAKDLLDCFLNPSSSILRVHTSSLGYSFHRYSQVFFATNRWFDDRFHWDIQPWTDNVSNSTVTGRKTFFCNPIRCIADLGPNVMLMVHRLVCCCFFHV